MRAIVCGGRDYDHKETVFKTLSEIGVTFLIEGGASGADATAADWALLFNVPSRRFNADWSAHGRAAGPIRNRQMLEEGKPDIVVAFPGGRGTANMIKQARKAGVEVLKSPPPHQRKGISRDTDRLHRHSAHSGNACRVASHCGKAVRVGGSASL